MEGLDVTDSLPMPRCTGLLVAIENMTSGALSVSERPFQSPKLSIGVQILDADPPAQGVNIAGRMTL